jgi:glutamate transport system permease protein
MARAPVGGGAVRTRRDEPFNVLFDRPGPRARRRQAIATAFSLVLLAGAVFWVVRRLKAAGQLDADLWTPFLKSATWTEFLLPGLSGTIRAAALAAVLALAFGVLFGMARLSDHRWISGPAGTIVECVRAVPLLILIFFLFSGPATIATALDREFPHISAFTALVLGLMLYNGAMLAEIVRAGVLAVPRGQAEAAYSLGLRKNAVMRLILLPQAVTAMMPTIISQLIVLLKDSALGWIIAYDDLLNSGFRQIPGNYGNLLPAAAVVAVIYIAINLALSHVAYRLERRRAKR